MDTMVQYMSHADIQYTSMHAGATAGRCQNMVTEKIAEQFMMCQDTDEAEIDTRNIGMVRSKIFNFHSIRSIIIVN